MSDIYSNPKVMEKFATGTTRDMDFVTNRLTDWESRYGKGNPFSGLTVRTIEESKILGNVVIGGGEEPNSSELAYFLREDEWNKRYGSEMVGAVTLFYAPLLKRLGFCPPKCQEFDTIIATSRDDNDPSFKILAKSGFEKGESSEKFGHQRHIYRLNLPKS